MGTTASKVKTAIENGDFETVSYRIENGFDVNTIITEGKTSLILAAAYNRIKIAELLIEKDANVHVTFAEGKKSALSEALDYYLAYLGYEASSGYADLEMVRILINKGAKVNVVDDGGRIPYLIHSILIGSQDLLELLIKEGANVDIKWLNKPALIYAIDHLTKRSRNVEIVELLIKEGADVNAEDDKGKTALYYAKNRGYTKITELLEKAEKAQAEKEEAAKAQLAHSAPVGADGGTSESEGDVKIGGEVTKEEDA